MRVLLILLILALPTLARAHGVGEDAGPDGGAADAGAPDAGPVAPDAGGDDADIGVPAPADDDGCSSAGGAGLAPALFALGLLAVRRRTT